MKKYQEINSQTIDKWVEEGWVWGIPIDHETFLKAKKGEWNVLLTPNKFVPHEWLGDLKGKKVLGLASGGGQQMPVFAALGAECTVLDYSSKQLESERMVAKREGYHIECIKADMTKKFPFHDESFDLIFHPVSNVYVEKVDGIFRECFRVLKKGGRLLAGLDNGFNFAFDEEDGKILFSLPFNPLEDPEQYEYMVKHDYGIQFSHSLEDQIGGQLKAGFRLIDLFDDTNGEGMLKEKNIPTFFSTLAIKE